VTATFDPPTDHYQRGLFEPTIAERYATWRQTEAGRVVYHEAHLRALQLRRRGLEHYGIAAIVEAIRYDRAVEIGEDDAGYRINNNHRAYLARELMAADPRLAGFFRTRDG
jgi:hypothetical protein